MKLSIVAILAHERGKLYKISVQGRVVSILLTFHTLQRMVTWRLTEHAILQALLFPEEVLQGHRGRFIAHRRAGRHVLRAVYEYEDRLPVVVTVYHPLAARYFQGGGTYEDRILS